MTHSRFQVGQLVRLKAVNARAPDLYKVVHILEVPPGEDVQYRLRGIHEPNARLVGNHQFSPATISLSPATIGRPA